MKFLLTFVLFGFASNAFAECNLVRDISVQDTYVKYSFECHQFVGKTFMDNEDRKKKITSLEEIVAYQKEQLALQTQRGDMWQATSQSLKKDVDSLSKAQETKNYLIFGSGVLTTILVVFAVNAASK